MLVKVNEKNLITNVYDNPVRGVEGLIEVERFVEDVRNAFYMDVVPRYKLVAGQPVERTQAEMDAEWEEPVPVPDPMERIAALEKELAAAKILLGVE